MNRIGDFGLSLGLFATFYTFRALDFQTIFATVPYLTDQTMTFLTFEMNNLSVITFFLFLGAVGKSAQIGLHTWLPDAMEG